jgi:hypothetical protein
MAECENGLKRLTAYNSFSAQYYYKNSPEIYQQKVASPLRHAIKGGNHRIVNLLLEAGADPDGLFYKEESATILDIIRKALKDVETKIEDLKKEQEKQKEARFDGVDDDYEELEKLSNAENTIDSLKQTLGKIDTWDKFVTLFRKSSNTKKPKSSKDLAPLLEERDNILIELCKNDDDGISIPSEYEGFDAGFALLEREKRRLKYCEEAILSKGGLTFAEKCPKEYKKTNKDNVEDANEDKKSEASSTASAKKRKEQAKEEEEILQIYEQCTAGASYERYIKANSIVGTRYRDLFNAVWNGDIPRIRQLTTECPVVEDQLLITARAFGFTPLFLAVMKDRMDVAEEIIQIAIEQREIPTVTKTKTKRFNNYESMNRYEQSDDDESDSDFDGEKLLEHVTDRVPNEEMDGNVQLVKKATSPINLINYMLATPDLSFVIGAKEVKKYDVLSFAIAVKDLTTVVEILKLASQVAAKEASLQISGHEQGKLISDQQFKICQSMVKYPTFASALWSLSGDYYNATFVHRAIEADNVEVVDFFFKNCMGNLFVLPYFSDLVSQQQAANASQGKVEVHEIGAKYHGLSPPSMHSTPLRSSSVATPDCYLLSLAASSGALKVLKKFMEPGYFEAVLETFAKDLQDSDDRAALVLRCGIPFSKIAARMLGLDPLINNNKRSPKYNEVIGDAELPFHAAVKSNQSKAIETLAQVLGAEKTKELLFMADKSGKLPLEVAATSNDAECAKELLKIGDVAMLLTTRSKNDQGWTPAHYAA